MAPRKSKRSDESKKITRVQQHTTHIGLIPPCSGPKLYPFKEGSVDVRFEALLSEETPGEHAHVFAAIIDSKRYALKMFKFYDPAEHAIGLHDRDVPEDLIIDHLDPFHAECRAYGCIEDYGCNGTVAVRCYGFLNVSAKREDELAQRFETLDWDRPSNEYDLPLQKRQPFRAIVKELIHEKIPFKANMITRMKIDLLRLRKMEVYPQDIRADNYRCGKLLDFSVSYTAPHIMLSDNIRHIEHIDDDIAHELVLFDRMIEESGFSTSVRMTPNQETLRKLRPRKGKES